MKNTYTEDRKSPKWQKRRLEIMERDRFTCRECGEEDMTLNVHHRYYISKRKPWEYPGWALITLCEDCHSAKHDLLKNEEGETIFEDWEIWLEWILASELKTGASDFSELWHFFASISKTLNSIEGVTGHYPYKILENLLEGQSKCIKDIGEWLIGSQIDPIDQLIVEAPENP